MKYKPLFNLNHWCENKPWPVQLTAKMFAPRLANLAEFCREARKMAVSDLSGELPFERWRKFYFRRQTVMPALDRAWGAIASSDTSAQLTAQMETIKKEMPAELPESVKTAIEEKGIAAIAEISPAITDMVESFGKSVDTWLNNLATNQTPDLSETDDPDRPGFSVFLARVLLPCVFLYHEQPFKVYRAARCGDPDAVDKLLRLDKSMISDRLIGEHWHRVIQGDNAALKEHWQKAIRGEPPQLTAKKMKVVAAAYVMIAAKSCQYRLTTEDIYELFHAMAKDLDGKPADFDLQDNPKTLYKAVTREAKALEKACSPDSLPGASP